MAHNKPLPPGQKTSPTFPRFGLPQYANRFPQEVDNIRITVGGEVEEFEISEALQALPRINQTTDFHCVTTWSALNQPWSGFRFKDFFTALIEPKANKPITFVILKAQDGYKTSLPLADLLQPNVLLADTHNNQPLSIEHGAPIRLVAPDHYGYKNLKHLKRIEFYAEPKAVKQGVLSFMDHPRARVALEERAANGPGLFFRYLYRFSVKKTMREFERGMEKYRRGLG